VCPAYISESKDVGRKTSKVESERGGENGKRKKTSKTKKPGNLFIYVVMRTMDNARQSQPQQVL